MLYSTNPVRSTNPSATDTARYFARNFMTRGLRHAFGMTGRCWLIDLKLEPRFDERADSTDDRKRVFSPGHRSTREAPAAWTAARRARHQICPRRAARPMIARTKTTICRVSKRQESRICSGVTRASFEAALGAGSALAGRGSSAEDNLSSECLNALSRLPHMELANKLSVPVLSGGQRGDRGAAVAPSNNMKTSRQGQKVHAPLSGVGNSALAESVNSV